MELRKKRGHASINGVVTIMSKENDKCIDTYLKGRNFGGFGGFFKNPPKSTKLTSR